jgi:hypothetical protein
MPNEKFIVLGAGLPRTGTLSLRTALEHLLGAPCYHMLPFVYNGTKLDTKHWKDALVKINENKERKKEKKKKIYIFRFGYWSKPI